MPPILAMLALCLGLASGSGMTETELAPTQVSTTTVIIPTYPYASFLETRHSGTYNMDYDWLNWDLYEASIPQPSPHGYTALVVENPCLRLIFLPELGGRLYGVTVKATGEELLYQNPVIRPTHWGPPEQGWWLAAGGIEWCLPVEEHGYEWGVPWSFTTVTATEGITVTLQDTTASDRVRARITVHLPADRAAFDVTPRLENPTGAAVTFKFWDNAMLAPGSANTVGPELRFVMPIDQVTVHSRGDDYLPGPGEAMDWPIHGGTDYARLGNWNRWLGFFARPQAAEDWAGVYDQGIARGLARVFPRQVAVGVKGFAFGWGDPIDWHEWTDDGSTYVELHSGPSPTFWDSITIDPGQAMEWTETWLPVANLPSLSLATADVALGVQAEGEDLEIGLLVAAQWDDLHARLWRRSDCELLWQESPSLPPGGAYTHHLPGLGLGEEDVVLGVFDGSTLLAATGDLTCPAPASQVDPLATVQTGTSFFISWSGIDASQGLEGFDIQVRDGGPDEPWRDWLTGTTATSAQFYGQDGHTYTFRSRAMDAFGNEEGWPRDAWQDAFTTILLDPAPVLITSDKVAKPERARPGDTVHFEIQLRNTGNLVASVQVTDPLPIDLALAAGPMITPPTLPDPVVVSDTILWSGTLDAGQTGATISFEAQVLEVPSGGWITNTAWIRGGHHGLLHREAAINGRLALYLPVVLRNAP